MKYQLNTPIQFGEQTITELNFRDQLVAGDFRGIPIRDPMLFDDILKLAGRLSAQPDPVINKLSFGDLTEVSAVVLRFMEAGPVTGNAPSQ